MISKKNKLNLKLKENKLIWRSSLKVRAEYFEASYDFKGKKPQMAVVITKKVLPKAVDRNELRRMIYDALINYVIKTNNLRLAIRVKSASLLKKNDEQLIKIFSLLLREMSTASQEK